jgi:hypothetical protein
MSNAIGRVSFQEGIRAHWLSYGYGSSSAARRVAGFPTVLFQHRANKDWQSTMIKPICIVGVSLGISEGGSECHLAFNQLQCSIVSSALSAFI